MKATLSLLILSLSIAGCNSGMPPAAYPGNQAPYPSDKSPTRPVFDASTGAIVGQLMSANTGQPAPNVTIFLSKLIPITPGNGHVLSFDLASAPQAQTKIDGSFIFRNIEPGEYGLLLWTPHNTSQVQNSNNSDVELVVIVEANKVVDIGTAVAVLP